MIYCRWTSRSAFSDLLSEVRLPPLLSFWSGEPVPSHHVPGGGGRSAVLVGRRYGQGRTAVLLSDSLWRWQLGSEAGGGGKSLYGRFLTQLLVACTRLAKPE